MKHLLLFLLLAFALPAVAQSEFVIDTSRTVKIDSVFYLDNFRIREDGTGQIPERTKIGDSTTYNGNQLATYIGKSRQWAYDAFEASKLRKLNESLNNIQRETVANTGYSISDSLKVIYGDAYTGNWVYRNGGNSNVTVSKAANGNLRARGLPGVAANAFVVMRIESDKHFQLRNYPTQNLHQTFVSQDGETFRNADINVNVIFKKK